MGGPLNFFLAYGAHLMQCPGPGVGTVRQFVLSTVLFRGSVQSHVSGKNTQNTQMMNETILVSIKILGSCIHVTIVKLNAIAEQLIDTNESQIIGCSV
jgi:hypothetical protein